MRSPSKQMMPASGLRSLVTRLKTVLLPEPLGPMRPTTVAGSTSKEPFATARSPPKAFVNPATASRGGRPAAVMPTSRSSLLLPGVGRRRNELAVGLGRDRGRVDRHLLAALDLDHDRLHGHPVALGQRRELARPPGHRERPALEGPADGRLIEA